MRTWLASRFAAVVQLALAASLLAVCATVPAVSAPAEVVALPSPRSISAMTLDDALRERRSVREFAAGALTVEMVGQLLWAAQGVTSPDGRRTAPSAGALYPLELFTASAEGVLRYRPASHDLVRIEGRDRRADLRTAALGAEAVGDAALVIVIAADPSPTVARYGADRGERYVLLEAGHVAQNILLEAVALGLGAVPIGAFDDEAVAHVIALPATSSPLYLIAIGHH